MKTIRRISIWWTGLSVASFATSADFYLAINGNAHPTGEQLFSAYSIIVFFAALGFVSIGAAVEEFINKK